MGTEAAFGGEDGRRRGDADILEEMTTTATAGGSRGSEMDDLWNWMERKGRHLERHRLFLGRLGGMAGGSIEQTGLLYGGREGGLT